MKKALGMLGCLLLTAGMLLAQAQQESLGEAARKLRTKKGKPTAAKVYTNDDLAGLAGHVSVIGGQGAAATTDKPGAAAPSAGPAAAGGAAPAAGEKKEEKGEAHWKGKFTEARTKLASAEKELDLLQREWQLERTQFTQGDPSAAMREQYLGQQAGGKLADLQKKIDDKRAEVARLKQELAELENELRREGGNPGWARP